MCLARCSDSAVGEAIQALHVGLNADLDVRRTESKPGFAQSHQIHDQALKWADIKQDLKALQAVGIEEDEKALAFPQGK